MKTRLKTLCLWWGLASGILFIICGIVVVCLFTPLVNAIIESKLTLVKDSEVLDAWIRPPIKPILKIHYFNVTNGEVGVMNVMTTIYGEACYRNIYQVEN